MFQRSVLSQLQRLLCALAGSVGITVALPTAAWAQADGYQASNDAPVAWRKFAERAQSQFRGRLSTDDAPARQLSRWLEDRAAIGSDPLLVVAKVWVTSAGMVERLEFDHLDGEVADSLRKVFVGIDLQATPPQDMLQPMHLKLSLGPAN